MTVQAEEQASSSRRERQHKERKAEQEQEELVATQSRRRSGFTFPNADAARTASRIVMTSENTAAATSPIECPTANDGSWPSERHLAPFKILIVVVMTGEIGRPCLPRPNGQRETRSRLSKDAAN